MHVKKIRNAIIVLSGMSILLLALSACSNKIYFTTSPEAPAARGYVKVKKDKNENYTIELSIENLAEVERLEGNNSTYVVWMNANGESPKNIGLISSDTKRFSKKLVASFNSVSAAKPTRIFITAEKDATVQYPGNFVVLTTENM